MEWEEDPLYFVFKDEKKGVLKMHTKKMNIKDWIKIDKSYLQQIPLRKQIMKDHFEDIFVSSDKETTIIAKKELLEVVLGHIEEYYPQLFTFERDKEGRVTKISDIFGDNVELEDTEKDPLLLISRLVQEDWCIMELDENRKQYILTAGVLCFPMGWSLHQKFNNPLHKIHKPVKEFESQLRENVESIFDELKSDKPIWRANWVISNKLNGPLDLYSPISHRHVNIDRKSKCGIHIGKELILRVEYQTLRRLPKSNAIVFSIRTYQRYLDEFKEFPKQDAISLVNAIQNTDKTMGNYKGIPEWGEAAIDYLTNYIIKSKSKL